MGNVETTEAAEQLPERQKRPDKRNVLDLSRHVNHSQYCKVHVTCMNKLVIFCKAIKFEIISVTSHYQPNNPNYKYIIKQLLS